MSSTIKRGVTYNRYNREVEENWNPEDTETQEKELMNKYNRIENRDIDSKYFIKRQTYTLKQRQEPLRSSLDKYGLRRLSDTWESQRFKYGKNNTDEHNEERKQSKSRERSRSPIEGVNKPRPSTVLKSKLNESEDPRPQKYKTEIIREEPKIELEENKIKDHEIGTEIDEIIETPDQYYLVDANHPIFLESPSRLKKEGETNEETIKKYESILRDINYEFKQLLKRNKYLEMKLENELKQIEPKAEIIEALQQQINELKSERQHQLTVYKLEQDKFNKEIASLQYQLNVHQDREEKYKTEKTNLQFSIIKKYIELYFNNINN